MASNRRLSTRALWGLASWALPLGVVFIVAPKLLEALGEGRFGVLMVAVVTPLIACQLELGISSAGVRSVAQRLSRGRVDAGTTLTTLMVALSAVGFAVSALIWFAADPLAGWLGISQVLGNDDAVHLVRTCALWVFVSLAALMPGVVARAAQAVVWIAAVQTLSTVALSLGALMLVRAGHSLSDVVFLGIGLTALSGLITLAAVNRHIDWRGPFRFDPRLLLDQTRFSGGMFAAQAAGAVVYHGDRMLIAALGSAGMAGAYALCANVTNKSLAGVAALSAFVFPHAAGLLSEGQQSSVVGLVHALDRAIAVLLVPFLLPGLLLTEPFLRLWLGDLATPDLPSTFRILLVAFAIPAFAVPVSHIVAASGRSTLAAQFAWLTAIVVLIAMLWLVPRYGLVGGATAMLLGNATSLVFIFVARRALGVTPAPERAKFWLGLAVGCAAQLALLAWLADAISGWITFLLIGAVTWLAFYTARAIASLLSPEERQLLKRFSATYQKSNELSKKT